jgi:hypothetical protein
MKIAGLVLIALAIGVGGWIGYRATDPANQRYCAWVRQNPNQWGIACADQNASKPSFHLTYYIAKENGPTKINSLP